LNIYYNEIVKRIEPPMINLTRRSQKEEGGSIESNSLDGLFLNLNQTKINNTRRDFYV